MARVIVGLRSYPPPPALIDAAREGNLAGLLWFREAFGETVEEAAARVRSLREVWAPSAPCLFAIDEEGGLIQQLSGLREATGEPWPRLPSPRALGRSGDPEDARAHGREIGRRLRRLGLDLALAPTVDLDPGPMSPVLGTRCLGEDPDRVASMALAWLRGLASAGVRGCVKHYPGHGATAVDSHIDLPRIPDSADMRPHLLPYERIARSWRLQDGPAPAVLTAHIVCGGSDLPASLDAGKLAELPRGLGPVITDSLDMGALSRYGDLEARARRALDAGSDLALIGLDLDGGLAVSRALPAASKGRTWEIPPRPAETPVAWNREELERVANAGLRIASCVPIPPGEWEWLLPEAWGAYGPVATPPAASGTRRWIGRLSRYRCDDLDTLERAILRADRPLLVGWIHRGPEDEGTRRILGRHGARVRAIAHLLDGPRDASPGSAWTIETCGFGEGELAALARRWAAERSA